jgi:hypothetical protein
MRRPPRRRQASGFVLVLVLAMLVVLGLLAGGIAATTARLLEQSQQRAQRMQDAIDMANTRATVLYLLSTQRMTVGGLTVDDTVIAADGTRRRIESPDDLDSALPVGNEIALDGRAYRGLGGAAFSLQDDYGLFGVNWNPPWMLQRLLAQAGPNDQDPQTLINRLLDYQDPDDLYRLNSAEAEGYRRAGLPPPSNRPLTTPLELLRVMGWREALSGLSPAEVAATVSVDNVAVINVNTAPERVLRTLAGVDATLARRAIDYRKVQPFLTENAFFDFLGLPKSVEAPVAVYPAMSGTLRLWPSHGGQVALVHWMLTPIEDGGRPWREDYELVQSQASAQDDVVLPVRSRLFAEPVAARP